MDEQILEEIGFTRNEIKIYLALLKLGASTTGKIIESTGLHRAIVYDTLEKLLKKGIVSFVIQNNRKVFKAYDPERLKNNIYDILITEKVLVFLEEIVLGKKAEKAEKSSDDAVEVPTKSVRKKESKEEKGKSYAQEEGME